MKDMLLYAFIQSLLCARKRHIGPFLGTIPVTQLITLSLHFLSLTRPNNRILVPTSQQFPTDLFPQLHTKFLILNFCPTLCSCVLHVCM